MPVENISPSKYSKRGSLSGLPLLCIFFLLLSASVKAQLTADFTASTTNVCGPAIVSFTSTVSGGSGAYVYSWDLGNGVISDEANPSTTYFNAGIYTIRLTVTNPATNQTTTVTKANYLTILAPPVVDFTADDTAGCFKHRVNFTNLSSAGSGTIQSFLWNFGNGQQDSVNLNPSTVYTIVSSYPVTLTVRNSNGCVATRTDTNYIDVTQGVIANFFAPAATGCSPPVSIPLQNTSTGPGNLTYTWNFGNGAPVSNEENPIAQYNTGGNYRITLLVNSDQGCFDSISRPVIIPNVGVVSSFDAPDTVCLLQPVQFENTSRPDPDLSVWSWGDGTRNDTSLSPIHTFTTAGTYNVRMINRFGTCVDSFIKPIVVLPASTVSFSSNDTTSCRVPHVANFTANAPGAVQWNWDFGDGGTGTGPTPSYQYRNFGNYTVRLTVRNAQGCATSRFINNYIRIARPRFTVRNLPDSGCAPFTKTPNILVETADGVQSMLWDFGDGTIINSLTPPTHTYTVPGTYRFKLVITTNTGCVDSVVVPNAVSVGLLPTTTPDFSATPTIACAGEDIGFTDLSPNPSQITGWFWEFGDGGRSFDQNPIHRYTDTGRFEVRLTIFNNGCGATISKADYIYTYGAVARFNYTVECSNKRTVRFRDSSLNASTVRWDFGDGSAPVNNVLNPVHTYSSLGRYPVVLTVTQGNCTYSDTQYIRLVDERAAFNINPNPLCKGLAVNFTAIGSADSNIARYEWDFGNGRFVQGNRSVLTTFPLTGLYTTRLRITDINGCRDSASRQLPVGGPKAGLGATNPTGCKGITVNFIDSSRSDGVNAIVQRIWDFGDGTVQTINAPPYQHTYVNPGTYSVKLKIIDAGGCADSITFRNFVTASNPRADFTVDSTESCPGSVVRFINLTNQNGGNINNFQWNFGDGTTSVINSPTKIYNTPGYYSVKLKIRDRFGCEDSLTRDSLVRVDIPVADFTLSDSLANCPPLRVDMRFTGHYEQTVRWDFGDGGVTDTLYPSYLYNLPGNYRVRLTVTSPGGCQDTMSKLIVINGPIAQYEFNPTNGCDSLTVNFRAFNTNNVDSIIWDFGDGRVITKDSSITYTYDHPGDYIASILLKDVSGCIVPIRGRDTIKVVGFNMGFIADTQLFCDSGTVQFTDTTRVLASVPITSWQWDFGDGTTSTLQNPRHRYLASGLYDVRLVVTSANGCIDTVTQASFIRVVRSPQTDINANANGVCEGGTITFRGLEIVPDTSTLRWSWDFANGQTSNLQNPPAQQYLIPGTYNVQLVATNSTGCTDTTIQAITVHPIPTVVASQDSTICLGQTIQLNATGTDNYAWLPPNPGLSCTDCPSPLATPAVTTTYLVRGSSTFGCANIDSVTITVIQPSTVVAPPNDSLCIGENVVLRASGTQVYSWSPATGLNNPNIPNPVARPTTTTTYTVTGSDFRGCFTTTDTVRVDVFPIPTVELGPDMTITAGTTNTVLNSTYSNDVVSLLWEPATGLSCTTCPTPIAAPRVSTTYTLRVTNNGGCVSSDAITLTVVCLNSNLFMPNTFSPNGDGMNDMYYPRGRGIERIKSLKIFNRWGQMVYIRENFSPNDASAGWDGRYKGLAVSPDVYVYMIDVFCENQSIITLKGDIMLVR
jgi:gliding motility-associated-like protein